MFSSFPTSSSSDAFLLLTLRKPTVTSPARLHTLTAFPSQGLFPDRNGGWGPNNRDVIDFRPRSTWSSVPLLHAARSDTDTFPVCLVFVLFRSRTRGSHSRGEKLRRCRLGHVALDSSTAAEVSVTQKKRRLLSRRRRSSSPGKMPRSQHCLVALLSRPQNLSSSPRRTCTGLYNGPPYRARLAARPNLISGTVERAALA